jgi:amino acid adenylation domain-containing protein
MSDRYMRWDISTPAQRRLWETVNATDAPAGLGPGIVELIDEHAAVRPGKVAVATADDTITYAELSRRSNQLAHHLLELGVARGEVCGLTATRQVTTYVALLGVLKAGAAYLPVDPEAPPARLSSLLSTAGVRVLLGDALTTASLRLETRHTVLLDRSLPFHRQKRLHGVLTDADDITACSEVRPAVCRSDRDLLYVIATSGSTGAPKAVMVEDRSLANLARWAGVRLRVDAHSRVAQNAHLTFDASAQQIFPALAAGATLLPVPDDHRLDPPLLLGWLGANEITHTDMVPSLWYGLVDHVASAAPEEVCLHRLGTVVLGGEPLRMSAVRTWSRTVGASCRIVHVYGPTEATVDASAEEVRDDEAAAISPIGAPLPNYRLHVVDRDLRLVLPGVEGELCIGGIGVVRGYLGDPSLTAASFLPDPFAAEPGARIYRTGDFASLRSDGRFVFRGRRDDQVKLAGRRVHLGEIEDALWRCPAVLDAVVCVEPGESPQVWAFYIGAGRDSDERRVRGELADWLPPSMLPHRMLRVREFPLTPNRKIDRHALLAMGRDRRSETGDDLVLSEPEAALLAIWRDVLGRHDVSVDDDFFRSGGDSISSIVLRHRCEAAALPIRTADVFRFPSVRLLAAEIERRSRDEAGGPRGLAPVLSPENLHAAKPKSTDRSEAPGHQRLPRRIPAEGWTLPLLPAQRAMIVESLSVSDARGSVVQEVYHCRGSLDERALVSALRSLVARQAALRISIERDGDSWLQRIRTGGVANVTFVRTADAGQRSAWLAGDLAQGFDITRWPLFRLGVLRRSPDEFDLVWTCHHCVMDGWSRRILFRELLEAYGSARAGSDVTVEPLDDVYASSVSARLTQETDESRTFWLNYLSGATTTPLPRESWVSAPASGSIEYVVVTIDPATGARIRSLAAGQGLTPSMVFMAAHCRMLQMISGQDEVVTSYVTAGRDLPLPRVAELVGCFINVVPFRFRSPAGGSLAQAAAAVAEQMLLVMPHEGFSAHELLGRAGLPGVPDSLFAYQNYPQLERLPSDGLGFEQVDASGSEPKSIPLATVCTEDPVSGGYVVQLEYQTASLSRETAKACAAMLRDALRERLDP